MVFVLRDHGPYRRDALVPIPSRRVVLPPAKLVPKTIKKVRKAPAILIYFCFLSGSKTALFGEREMLFAVKIDNRLSLSTMSSHFAGFVPVSVQGPVSRKSRKRLGPEKPFVKLPTACFGKPIF